MSKIIKEGLIMLQINCNIEEGTLIRTQGYTLLELKNNK